MRTHTLLLLRAPPTAMQKEYRAGRAGHNLSQQQHVDNRRTALANMDIGEAGALATQLSKKAENISRAAKMKDASHRVVKTAVVYTAEDQLAEAQRKKEDEDQR